MRGTCVLTFVVHCMRPVQPQNTCRGICPLRLLEDTPAHIRLGITRYHLLDSLDRSRDNKQQELTSLTLETPLPKGMAVTGYAGQCDAVVGKKTVRST